MIELLNQLNVRKEQIVWTFCMRACVKTYLIMHFRIGFSKLNGNHSVLGIQSALFSFFMPLTSQSAGTSVSFM